MSHLLEKVKQQLDQAGVKYELIKLPEDISVLTINKIFAGSKRYSFG